MGVVDGLVGGGTPIDRRELRDRVARYFRFMSLTPDGEVRSRDGLVSFVRELHQEYLRNGHEWENRTLGSFLEALAASTSS
ncbi:DUF7660 family protein [Streptomyces sp. NPDC003863]